MNQVSTQQLIDITRNSIVVLIDEKKSDVIAIARKNGIDIPQDINNDELFAVVIKAMKDSVSFRKDIAKALKSTASEYSNYVDEDLYADAQSKTAKKPYEETFFGSIFSKERLGQIVDTGVALYSSTLANKQQRQGEQNAINYELAQAQKIQVQQDKTFLPTKKSYALPIIIGVLVLGSIGAYFYYKNKK
jgi:uncharacterized membrane protein (UPF0136 family)